MNTPTHPTGIGIGTGHHLPTDEAANPPASTPAPAAGGARRIRGTPPPPPTTPAPQRRASAPNRAMPNTTPGRPVPGRPPTAPTDQPAASPRRPRNRPTTPNRSAAAPVRVDSPTAVRLAKRVMDEADCSRAQAEQLIETGRVRVDGVLAQDPPMRVEPDQRVEVQGTQPAVRLEPATLLLHKPAGLGTQAMLTLLTEANHLPKDRSGLQLLKKHLTGLNCLTPLEPAASGLVIWSQHGGIARKLLEDASTVEHEALALVNGTVSPAALKLLNASAVIDGRAMSAARVSINQAQPEHTTLRFAFKGYHPGQVAQLCEQAGLELTALRRLRIGRLPLASLPEGQWRFLLGYERF